METNTNTPEAKQPASAGCHFTTCSAICPCCLGAGQYLDSEGMPRLCEECSDCCANCKWSQEKEDRYDQVRCCCNESPNAWGDIEAADVCSYFLPNAKCAGTDAGAQDGKHER